MTATIYKAETSVVKLAQSSGVTTLWCYNGGSPASIELGTTTAPSGKGNVVGRSMSNHLEIPLGDKLWRNGRLRTLAELSGTGSWTNLWARSISPENGIIAGYATNQAGEWHSIMFLPCALIDLNGGPLGSGSNVSITPKKDANDTNPKSIAWIAPHRKSNGPDMPQLILKVNGIEGTDMRIRWKLKVTYMRPSGRVLVEDTVNIPSMTRLEDGTVTSTSQDGWVTETTSGPAYLYGNPGSWNNENDWSFVISGGFFAGEAELTYQIIKSDKSPVSVEQKILFRIGGKNPTNEKCRSFINGQRNPNEWFSDAIAKHETAEYRYAGSLYNQFRSNPSNGQVGMPTWNNDGDGKPGGYGVFQITGTPNDAQGNIPRGQIWNWQDNVRAYFEIIRDPIKSGLAIRHATRCRNIDTVKFDECPAANNTITYSTTRFTSNDSVWITAYNGWGAQSVDEQYVFTPTAPIPANQILNSNNSFGLNTRWYWNPPLKKSGKGANATYNSYLQLIQKQIQ